MCTEQQTKNDLSWKSLSDEIKNKGASVTDVPLVRSGGLEPPRLAAIDPKSIAATSYATTACSSSVCRGTGIRTPDLLLPKQTR